MREDVEQACRGNRARRVIAIRLCVEQWGNRRRFFQVELSQSQGRGLAHRPIFVLERRIEWRQRFCGADFTQSFRRRGPDRCIFVLECREKRFQRSKFAHRAQRQRRFRTHKPLVILQCYHQR